MENKLWIPKYQDILQLRQRYDANSMAGKLFHGIKKSNYRNFIYHKTHGWIKLSKDENKNI